MKRDKGFTLIELMVVIAILGILASIAVPSYSQYIQRSKRSEGTSALAMYNSKMANYYLDNNNYGNGVACAVASPAGLKYFTFNCVSANAQSYTATATGINDIANTSYVIDQTDAKSTPTFPSRTNASCWLIAGSEC